MNPYTGFRFAMARAATGRGVLGGNNFKTNTI